MTAFDFTGELVRELDPETLGHFYAHDIAALALAPDEVRDRLNAAAAKLKSFGILARPNSIEVLRDQIAV